MRTAEDAVVNRVGAPASSDQVTSTITFGSLTTVTEYNTGDVKATYEKGYGRA